MLRDLAVWFYMRLASILMALLATGLSALGLTQASSEIQLMRNGERTIGTVVELRERAPTASSATKKSEPGQAGDQKATVPEQPKPCAPAVAPTIEFKLKDGTTHRYKSSDFACPAAFAMRDSVNMLVNTSKPDDVAKIDGPVWSVMFPTFLLGGVAFVTALFGWLMLPKRDTIAKLFVDPPIEEAKEVVALADLRGQKAPPSLAGIVASADLIREGKYPLDLCELCAYLASLAYQKIRTDGGDDKLKATVKVVDYLNGFPSYSGKSPFTDVAVFFAGSTEGFGLVLDGARFIVLRGTTGWADWKVNLDAGRTKATEFVPGWISGPAPSRHHGFAGAWSSIRDQVVTWIDQDPARAKLPIIISGHSLGGALSFVGAWELASYGRDIKAVITFGAALPGGSDFALAYANVTNPATHVTGVNLSDRTLRLEFTRDLVPVLQKLVGYVPVGHAWEPKQLPFISMGAAIASLPVVWLADKLGKGLVPTLSKGGSSQGATAVADVTAPLAQRMRWWFRQFIMFTALSGRLALDAHAIQKRYALALSIMSYRRIRARQLAASGTTTPTEEQLKSSYEWLSQHLRTIRGSGPDHPAPFDTIPNLPRVIGSPGELRWYKAFFPARSW